MKVIRNNGVCLLAILLCLIVSAFVLCNLNMFNKSAYARSSEIEVMAPARGMVVLEGNTNKVLYGFNKDLKLPMASTTKIATAIVAIENCDDLNKMVKVSDKSVGIEGTSIYLKHGEEISFKDLLFGLMLASGNDCAVALAEEVCGEENFVKLMNDFAKNIGAENTHFVNPHGLDADGHYTTAHDLALITSYALKNEIFKEIASTKFHTINETNVYQPRYLKHKNKLLFSDENCIGVKTGFTDNAGRCLVSASEKDGMKVISVVLNCQPMFEECNRLTKLAFDTYEMKNFVAPYNFVSTLPIENGNKNEIGICTLKGFSMPILKGEVDCYDVEYDLPDILNAPIAQNTIVGKVRVLYRGELIYEDNLYAIDDVENIDLSFMLDNIISNWF